MCRGYSKLCICYGNLCNGYSDFFMVIGKIVNAILVCVKVTATRVEVTGIFTWLQYFV